MIGKIGMLPISAKVLPLDHKKATGAADLGQSFGHMLNQALTKLDTQEKAVAELNEQFIRGEEVDVHQLMIQSERMSLGLEMTVQIRNKALEAYQDILRMQI